MAENQPPQQQPPGPDPALRRLEPLIGTWSIRGRTLDSTTENVSARATFEWLPGGFFLKQTFEAGFRGMRIQSLELIGYNPESDTFPSTVYSNLVGVPIPYRYDLRGRDVTITTDLAGGARMTGRIAEDGNSFSGGWRPNPGAENQGNEPIRLRRHEGGVDPCSAAGVNASFSPISRSVSGS